MIATAAGPALYLLAQAALRLRATGGGSRACFAGVIACVVIGSAGGALPTLALQALLAATLLGVIAADAYRVRKPLGAPPRAVDRPWSGSSL